MATNEVVIKITGQDNASAALKGVGQQASGLGGIFKTAAGTALGFAGALGGIAAVKGAFNFIIGGAMEAQQVMAQTEAVLKSTGNVAGFTAQEINNMADELSKTRPIDDEVIQKAENLLLTFTNIGHDVFPQATKAILDMSVAMGQDLQSTTIQVGKALQSPVEGATALQRVGVRLSDSQKELIESLVAVGDTAGAQAIILRELETEFGGSAEAAGKTFPGQLKILMKQLNDVGEGIGLKLLPHMAKLLAFMQEHGPAAIARMKEEFGKLSTIIKTEVIPSIKEFWEKHGPGIIQFAKDAAKWFIDFELTLLKVYKAIGEFLLPALDTLRDLWDNLQPVLDKIIPPLREVWDFLTKHKEILIALGLAILLITNPWLAVVAVLAVVLAKWDEISKMFTVTIPAAIDNVIKKVTEFPIIGEIITGVFNAIKIVTETAWALIQNRIETAINVIRDIIKIVTALIHGDWSAAWEGVKQLVSDIWAGIRTEIEIVLGAIKDLIWNHLETIKGIWDVGWNTVKQTLSDIWDGIKGIAGEAIATVLTFVRDMFQGIKDAADAFPGPNPLGNAMQSAIDGMTSVIDAAKATVSQKANEVGAAITSGFISGIEAQQSDAWAAAYKLAEDAAAAMAAGAQTYSPSRLTMKVGEGLVQGVILGIIRTLPALREAMAALMAVLGLAPNPGGLTILDVLKILQGGVATGGAPSSGGTPANIPGLQAPSPTMISRDERAKMMQLLGLGPNATAEDIIRISGNGPQINITIQALDGASVKRVIPELAAGLKHYLRGSLA